MLQIEGRRLQDASQSFVGRSLAHNRGARKACGYSSKKKRRKDSYISDKKLLSGKGDDEEEGGQEEGGQEENEEPAPCKRNSWGKTATCAMQGLNTSVGDMISVSEKAAEDEAEFRHAFIKGWEQSMREWQEENRRREEEERRERKEKERQQEEDRREERRERQEREKREEEYRREEMRKQQEQTKILQDQTRLLTSLVHSLCERVLGEDKENMRGRK